MCNPGFMEKRFNILDFTCSDYSNENSRVLPFVQTKEGHEPDDRVIKSAACSEAIEYASTLKPIPGRRIILVVSFGEFETWGDNKKGDAFPNDAIFGRFPKNVNKDVFSRYSDRLPKLWGIKTFPSKFNEKGEQIGGGNTFLEHINQRQFYKGFILKEFFNQKMRRVEIVQDVIVDKVPKYIIERIDKGFPVKISMACRVPFDRCNICGNLARTQKDYCPCLTTVKRGSINFHGLSHSMLNDFPDYFDNSIVEVPAADEGMMLTKIASNMSMYSSKSHENDNFRNFENFNKRADFINIGKIQEHRINEPSFPKSVIDKLRTIPLPLLIKYLGILGLYPTGADFAKLLLNVQDQEADLIGHECESNLLKLLMTKERFNEPKSVTIINLTSSNEEPSIDDFRKVVNIVKPFMSSKSYHKEYLLEHPKTKAAKFIDIKGDLSKLSDEAKLILLFKVFNDKNLINSINQVMSKPAFSAYLKMMNMDNNIDNNKNIPVYTKASDEYTNDLTAQRIALFKGASLNISIGI